MRSFLVLSKKDLRGYFDQPTGYILIVIFLGLTSWLFFRTALVTEEASLRPLFESFLPWVLAIFVPAATMRLIAEEQRDGTLEILLTQPIRAIGILFSKFSAGLIFVLIGVAFTVGLPLSLMTAGDLDEGAIIAQYIGTFFLTASFVSIGLFASSLTRNQIVAFMTALTLTMVLMLAGLPLVTLALPRAAAVLVQGLSPLTHYSGIARGVLDLRDVLYFISIISVFLSGTYLAFRAKTVSHRSSGYLNLQLGVAGLVVVSLLVGWFGGEIRGRWDLTEQKLYTLSPAAQELFANLDDIVTVKLFASKDPPPQIALTKRDVNDFLDDVASASDGKVRVVRVYPDESDEAEEEALRSFVPPVQFSDQSAGEFKIQVGYLGMGMRYANRHEVIQYVETVDGLEYQVAAGLFRMAQKQPKEVAVLSGFGGKRRDAELQSFRNQLEQHHILDEVGDAGGGPLGLDITDVLIVAGPTEWVPRSIYDDIHDYLARGGKVLLMLDPVTIDNATLSGTDNENSMTDFLHEYGINLQQNIVFDTLSNETLSFRSQFGAVQLPYPYWPRVETVDRKIAGGVGSVILPWASSLKITEPAGKTVDVEVTPLLETTESGALDEEYFNISPQSPTLEGVPEDQLGKKLLAVSLTGTRCPVLQPKCEKDPDKPFRMIVVGDSDWISESMVNQYGEHLAMGVNFVDWLTQDDALAAVRAKGSTERKLVFDTSTHRNLVRYANIVGVPFIFVLLGLTRYFMRRNAMRKVYTRAT